MFLKRQVEGNSFTTLQHLSTGFINISPFFRQIGIKSSDFTKSNKFKQELEQFAARLKCKKTALMFVKSGGNLQIQGTWISPQFMHRFISLMPDAIDKQVKFKLSTWSAEWGTHKNLDVYKESKDLFHHPKGKKVDKQPDLFTYAIAKAAVVKATDPAPAPPPVVPQKENTVTISKEEHAQLLRKSVAYTAIMRSGGFFSLDDMAKMIGVKKLGRVNLRKWMVENKIVFYRDQRIIAHQDYINRGWAKLFSGMYNVEKHMERRPYTVTRYTMKGVVGIFEKLKEQGKVPKDASIESQDISDEEARQSD